MSFNDCLTKAKDFLEKSGLEISEGRLKELAHQLNDAQANSMTRAEFSVRAQEIIDKDNEKFSAAIRAKNAMFIAKREEAVANILDNKSNLGTVESVKAWLGSYGVKPGEATNLDPSKMREAIKADILGTWRQELTPELQKVAQNGILNKETYQELWAIDKGLPLGESHSNHALEIAKAVKATLNKIFDIKKSYNPFMEKADEYLVRQTHNAVKVGSVPKEEWVSDAMNAFGKKSFPDLNLQEKSEVFSRIYDRIKDGSYGSVIDDEQADKFVTVKGPGGDLTRRMAAQRKLIADDWKSVYDYNQKYGYGTIEDTVMNTIDKASQDISMMDKFGHSPIQMKEQVIQRLSSKLDPSEVKELKSGKKSIEKAFQTVTGSINEPADKAYARASQGLLSAEYLAHGGTSWLRSLPDIALGASLIKDLNGRTVAGNAFDIASAYMKNFASDSSREEAMSNAWLYARSTVNEMNRDLGASARQPGGIGKAVDLYGSLTMMQRHVNAQRAAVASVLMNNLGKISDQEFSELSPRWQQGLKRYGIGDAEWSVLRKATEDMSDTMKDAPSQVSRKSMTKEGVQAIPDSVIENYMKSFGAEKPTPQSLFLARKQLEYKLGTMVNELSDMGTAHAGSQERAAIFQGTSINEPLGAFLRLAAQFKQASVTSYNVYRRNYFSSQGVGASKTGAWAGVGATTAIGMFMWSLGEFANQGLQGKTPEDPMTPEFAAKAMIGSGAAGIYGDILVNEAEHAGVDNKVLATLKGLAGPAIGDVAQAGALGVDTASSVSKYMMSGNDRSLSRSFSRDARFGMSALPGQNLLWSKGALNYYIFNGIKEFLGPGYLSHLENQVSKTPGLFSEHQEYWTGKAAN